METKVAVLTIHAPNSLPGPDYFTGPVLATGLIVVYSLRGGLRSAAWTDLFQGSLTPVPPVVALVLIAALIHPWPGQLSSSRQ